jgi:hypothetical protein
MSTEIAQHTSGTLAEKMEFSKALSSASMLPRAYQNNPANLLLAVEYADTLGIPRITALTSIHVIDGKPTASADLIANLVRRAGHKLRVEGDDTYAEAVIIRADDPDYVPKPIRWDEAKARKAGKWGAKGPWTNYPGAMLRSRAITEAARMWASDALYGVIYTPEEIGANVAEDGTPAVITTAQPPRTEPQSKPLEVPDEKPQIPANTADAIANADTMEKVEKIADWLQRNFGADADDLIAACADRVAALAAPEPTPEEAEQTLTDVLNAEVVDA